MAMYKPQNHTLHIGYIKPESSITPSLNPQQTDLNKNDTTKLSNIWSSLKMAVNKITILKHEIIQHAFQ
jgi:hypothetical protein